MSAPDLLLPGDYQARLVRDSHENAHEIRQTYEIRLASNRTMKFDVTGAEE
jgi:hypothetical protein